MKLNINNIVNKVIAGRIEAEYCIDNKEHIAEYNKHYYNDNKLQILDYHKQHYINNKEHYKQYCLNQ